VKRFILEFIILAAMLLGLPMLGVFWAGLPVIRYLSFPPMTRYVDHAAFSWIAFTVFGVITIAVSLPFFLFFKWTPFHRDGEMPFPEGKQSLFICFPWWGWTGIVLGIVSWILAWNRFTWFSSLQPHTFTPLWLSYILVINAMTYRRTKTCIMISHSTFFLLLFPASAVFWWFFEYLNRFVQNWYYVGPAFNALEYFWFATLPFSTVLPAVWSTKEWIGSHARLRQPQEIHFPGYRDFLHKYHWIILVLSGVGLMAIGIYPDYLFPLVWISPLLIIVSLQSIMGEPHIFSYSDPDQWQQVATAALAALVCGFFWEMWNTYSLAKWEYSIPFVHRFKIFEMPLLGYAGYLPFGLECLAVGQMIEKLINKY